MSESQLQQLRATLDALEQLSIVRDTNADENLANVPSLDSLPEDVKLAVLKRSSLETCLALSESCRSFRTAWKTLDDTLVREKVLSRVPWFRLDEAELTSWNQCAKVLVSRTQKSLRGDDEHKKGDTERWMLTKSIQLFQTSNYAKHIRVDSTDVTFDHEVRQNMTPLFANETQKALVGLGLRGSKLLGGYKSLDLKTLTTRDEETNFNMLDVDAYELTERITTPSGLQLQHADYVAGRLTFVAENDLLIHLRYSRTMEEIDEYDPRGMIDTVIHKESHERDETGCYIIDPDYLIIQHCANYEKTPLINLVPGAGGAIIAKFTASHKPSSYLGYIEPTAELRHVILCAIPTFTKGGYESFAYSFQKFCVFYNGYLYYVHQGRFMQLWVDLGYKKMLKLPDEIVQGLDHDLLPQQGTSRALTAFNMYFPMLGTFALQPTAGALHGIVQGDRSQGLDRFVTLRRARGHVVGDLLTGTTYVCKRPKNHFQLAIPYIDNKEKQSVGFYSFSPPISLLFQDTVARICNENLPAKNLNPLYCQQIHLATMSNSEHARMFLAINRQDGTEWIRDRYLYPHRMRYGKYSVFSDVASEFTKMDEDVELKLREDQITDEDDWDCADDNGRSDSCHLLKSEFECRFEYDYAYDSDEDKSPEELKTKYNGKPPSLMFKRGFMQAVMGVSPDEKKTEYRRGYQYGFRKRFGYVDPDDVDEYTDMWGDVGRSELQPGVKLRHEAGPVIDHFAGYRVPPQIRR
ncbi:hypothetical protein CJU90_1541 [Yarrowia sp. C11]|nr:hypothetical protein CKK34_0265 [Yarrowia sp. E02]KAG5371507.1 hypothetical protein CJU90_1541 [Yarrowia sp. C11]